MSTSPWLKSYLVGHNDKVTNYKSSYLHLIKVFYAQFSSDGELIATASMDKTLRLWKISSGECVHTFVGHTGWVLSCCFSPNGKLLASSSDDRTIKVWNVESRVCVNTINYNTTVRNVTSD